MSSVTHCNANYCLSLDVVIIHSGMSPKECAKTKLVFPEDDFAVITLGAGAPSNACVKNTAGSLRDVSSTLESIQRCLLYQSPSEAVNKVILDDSHAFYAIQLYAKRNEYRHCLMEHSESSNDLSTRLSCKVFNQVIMIRRSSVPRQLTICPLFHHPSVKMILQCKLIWKAKRLAARLAPFLRWKTTDEDIEYITSIEGKTKCLYTNINVSKTCNEFISANWNNHAVMQQHLQYIKRAVTTAKLEILQNWAPTTWCAQQSTKSFSCLIYTGRQASLNQ